MISFSMVCYSSMFLFDLHYWILKYSITEPALYSPAISLYYKAFSHFLFKSFLGGGLLVGLGLRLQVAFHGVL